jgi:arsenic resistance protein ArsH
MYSVAMNGHGDLNNTHAVRATAQLAVDSTYAHRSFAIPAQEDDAPVRATYRPFLLPEELVADDWIAKLELSTVLRLVESEILLKKQDRLRILVLYGSLRSR